jgi:hypothetical protein
MELYNYSEVPLDGKVVAWVVEHSEPDRETQKTDITFKVKVQVLKKLEEAKEPAMAETSSAGTASEESATGVEVPDPGSKEAVTEGERIRDEL